MIARRTELTTTGHHIAAVKYGTTRRVVSNWSTSLATPVYQLADALIDAENPDQVLDEITAVIRDFVTGVNTCECKTTKDE
jgi:hypothetical protein